MIKKESVTSEVICQIYFENGLGDTEGAWANRQLVHVKKQVWTCVHWAGKVAVLQEQFKHLKSH